MPSAIKRPGVFIGLPGLSNNPDANKDEQILSVESLTNGEFIDYRRCQVAIEII